MLTYLADVEEVRRPLKLGSIVVGVGYDDPYGDRDALREKKTGSKQFGITAKRNRMAQLSLLP